MDCHVGNTEEAHLKSGRNSDPCHFPEKPQIKAQLIGGKTKRSFDSGQIEQDQKGTDGLTGDRRQGDAGDGFVKGNTVIDVNLSNVNPVIHVPGTVLGAAVMQNFDTVLGQDKKNYSLYGFALCPAIAEVQAVFWEEEKALAKAMNVGLCTVNYEDFFSRTTMYSKEYMGPDFAVPFEEKYENFYGDGPFDLENRYITEDVPVGCFLIQQLGKKYNVPTPTVDAMIYLANIMIKRDLIAGSKYTLDYLEIGHMNDEQPQKYIREGVFTPVA